MRARLGFAVAAAAALGLVLPAHGALAQQPLAYGIAVLPAREAKIWLDQERGALAAGVFPDSRDAAAFWREVAAGAPRAREGVASPLGGRPCALGSALRDAGLYPRVRVLEGAPAGAREALDAVLCTDASEPAASSPLHHAVAAPTAQAASAFFDRLIHRFRTPVVVLGTEPRTPVIVGVIGARRGTLGGGMARRPGIATPYDVTATILSVADAGADRPGIAGKPLRSDGSGAGSRRVEEIAARLERDASFGPAHAAATITVIAGAGVILTGLLFLLRAPRLALRSARGGAAAVPGYVASLFVQSGNAGARAIPIALAYVLGFAWPDVKRVRRDAGYLLGAASIAIAVLTIAAALRPGGEPALSLWGDPLVSWRLFGLRNHLASMVQLGAIGAVALAMDRPSPIPQAVAGVAGAVIVGAAVLGANFVAVLTLVFGASIVAVILWRRAVTLAGIAASAALAVAAFAVALLADSGSPASHGGQAVGRVRDGGFDAAWNFLSIRWRANVREISSYWGGWVWTTLLVAGLIALVVWALRDQSIPLGPRAVILGAGGAALAALLLEDTGFLAGGIIAFAAGLAAAPVLAERVTPRSTRAGDAASDTPGRRRR